MTQNQKEAYEEAKHSLTRIQNFDVNSLPRDEEFGANLSFRGAIAPAQQLIDLYKKLSVEALEDFPETVLKRVKSQADSSYNLFEQILDFDVKQQNPVVERDRLIENINKAYPTAFTELHPYISYSLHRVADFQRLEEEARATFQGIKDKAAETDRLLTDAQEQAEGIVEEIRSLAAEEGVTKQAIYFKAAYEKHTTKSLQWRRYAVCLAIFLVFFAGLSLFIHKIPFLKPENAYDAFQLSVSKVLIFSVIAYMLFLSAKNFLNHKHNAIVNMHRQNALMTHGALVEASGEEGVRDAVLLQAASCIFSPQVTGYAAESNIDMPNQKSMVEILSRPFSREVESG